MLLMGSRPILGEKDIQIPDWLLQEVDTQFIEDMGSGYTPGSLIRNIIFVKTERHISKENINYIIRVTHQLHNENEESDSLNLFPFDSILKKCEKNRLHGTIPRSIDRVLSNQLNLLH